LVAVVFAFGAAAFFGAAAALGAAGLREGVLAYRLRGGEYVVMCTGRWMRKMAKFLQR